MILPRVIGHRGAAQAAPENTLAGLAKAAALGAPWVEFDVMLSQDGVALLHHDLSLKRTCGLDRPVAETPFSQIAALDAGSWFAPSYAGEPVPSFAAAIDKLGELGLGANVEIKPAPGRERETAKAVVELLRQRWPGRLPQPLLSSFSLAALEAAREADDAWPRGYLVEELPENWEATARRLGCVSVHPWRKSITQEQVAAIGRAGFRVAIYTVNEVEEAKRLLSWGVDCIITDAPDRLLGL